MLRPTASRRVGLSPPSLAPIRRELRWRHGAVRVHVAQPPLSDPHRQRPPAPGRHGRWGPNANPPAPTVPSRAPAAAPRTSRSRNACTTTLPRVDGLQFTTGDRTDMLIERLTERIGRAVQHVQFRNVYGNRFDSPVMRELYAKKMKRDYSLSTTDAISVHENALTDSIDPSTARCVRAAAHSRVSLRAVRGR